MNFTGLAYFREITLGPAGQGTINGNESQTNGTKKFF